ncbi:hypothetical protein C5614_31435 [Massilia phosphatilytica]|nr:hypothetical protein C5614_31435 [Massilia phosphatilytica]
MPWEVRGEGGTLFLDVPCVATFNTIESEVAAVSRGIGIGQLAAYMIDDELASGKLVHLLPELDTRSAGIYMYYPQRTRMPSRVRLFIDYAFEAAKARFGLG